MLTGTPYLLIHGAAALELLGDPHSIPALLTVLAAGPIAPARDEVILATAGILDMADTFYANYRGFLADADQGMALLADFMGESRERHPLDDPSIELLASLPELIGEDGFT
jgi:chloramphenicol 3-O-phosphotransferase